jgi:hypothetical protein
LKQCVIGTGFPRKRDDITEPNSNIPDCINGDKVIVSSPGVFNELQKLLAMKII